MTEGNVLKPIPEYDYFISEAGSVYTVSLTDISASIRIGRGVILQLG
jgi:hypothetical protein